MLDQWTVASPGHPRELLVRLRLLHRRLELRKRRLGLGDLVVELRGDDLHQQLPLLHVIADVDIALVDIAAGASEYVGDRKRGGRGRQRDRHIISARPHRLNPQGRDGIETLLGGRHSPYTLGI